MNSGRAQRVVGTGKEALPERIAPHRATHTHSLRKPHRPLRVMKFGGTSVGDADCIRRVIEIIRAESAGSDVVTVVSAMSGVTNNLLKAAVLAEMGKMSEASGILQQLKAQHYAAVEALVNDVVEKQLLFQRLDNLLDECHGWYEEAALTRSVAPALRDLVSGVGERLSAPILAAALAAKGFEAEALEATQVVVTTSLHGAADPLMIPTAERCEKILIPMLRKGVLPVVTGFIGATPDGIPTTLGRGGSDYSATILGAAVGADEVIIWTDVDGMLTADPRLVPMARTIPEISYREAAELAYFGAKVLHPKTLDPVMKHGIPVWIRNTFAPLKRGTKINLNSSNTSREAKALASVNEAAIVTLEGVASSMLETCRRRTVSSASALRAHVLMNSQSESRQQIHLVLAGNPVEAIEKTLRHEFKNEIASGDIRDIRCDSGVAVLTVVGQNLEGIKEIVHCATNELERQNVRVLASGQNSSDCSVSFVVHSDQVNTALAAAHHALQMRSSDPALRRRPEQAFENSGFGLSQQRRTRAGESVTLHARNAASRDEQARECVILDEASFRRMIALERKRSERSRKPMLLMLLDAGSCLPFDRSGRVLSHILSALSLSTRDTDVAGWYKEHSVVGVMFTEISLDDHGEILATMMHRVSQTLKNNLTLEKFSQIRISMHLFPEAWTQETAPGNPTLYPDLAQRDSRQRGFLALKRGMDIIGSMAGLMLLSPLFLLVAVLVKLSSKGPVLFKQERLGQFGRPFTFLKFRSMYMNNDPKIHQEFMKQVISGKHDGEAEGASGKVYKMTNDPRITPIGRFLRRSSLDELPQFLNVLRGDMSLVGPRPPLAYECKEYDIWHRRRVLEIKPGITGLWQVRGRSRVRFDDMVRLDLEYVRSWSLWLDMKILLQTPAAVLLGDDAF